MHITQNQHTRKT